jgi:hypothetical protein
VNVSDAHLDRWSDLGGFAVEGEAEGRNEKGFPITRVAWIDGPDRASAAVAVP